MRIDRNILINNLFPFSQKGNGIIIGKPGIGKSYALSQLSDSLWDNNIPSFIIKIDEIDGTDQSLQVELDTQENWISFLDSVKLPSDESKAVLIFDAFDAARDESLRKQYISQIRKAISGLKKWNVIVSIRTYDATKSPQLIKLFGANKTFEIGGLNEQELKSAFDNNPALGKMYDLAGDELKSVLKIPFFLRLLEIVLVGIEDAEYDKIKLIKSEAELLDKFWKKKISNTENSYNKEALLKQLSYCLVQNKTLSYLKDKFIQDSKTFKELRSDDIISEVGVSDHYVAFSHNILFDYIIGRLTIPVEPIKLVEYISQDKSRPFFLRPSFIFHFTRLWYKHRKEFWESYKHLNSESDAHIVLFKRLIPTSVIANEFETIDDLESVISNIDSIQKLLQSIRFLSGRILGVRDIELLYELSDKLNLEFLWDYAFVFDKIIRNENFNKELYKDKCGIIARRFLEFILVERKKRPERSFSLDRLGSTRGIEFVSRTFKTDIDKSKLLLKQILTLLKEPEFEIWYFSSLSDNIEHFASYDPEFVAEIYQTIFAHTKESNEKTNMVVSVALNLISNRSQDFEMCYYKLIEFFPNFLKISPEIAIRIGLEIVNSYVIKDKLYVPSDTVSYHKIQINDIVGTYLPDNSSMWNNNLSYHKPAQLEIKIILYLKELVTAGNVGKLDSLLQVYFSHAVVGFTWKKLIELANEYPNIFKNYLFQLTLNQIILDSSDTTYEIGISLEKIYPELNPEQREKVEESILKLLETEKDQDNKYADHKVNRLLNCIPKKLLTKEESINIINESNAVKNEPTFKSSCSSEPYTTDKWLEEQGIDLNEEENKEVYELLSQLESFNHQRMNDTPNRMQFAVLLPIAKKLFLLIKDDGKYKDELCCSAIKEVSKYYSIITRDVSQIENEDYQIAKEAIVYGLDFISKYDESFDDSSSPATGYSPTPRIEASSALTGLLRFNNDEEIFQLILKNIVDTNPIIRFNILRNISQVWLERPDDFWELVFERLANEPDSFTMATVLNNASRSDLIEKNEKLVVKAAQIASDRINEFGTNDSFWKAYGGLLLFLLDRRKNKIARGIIYDNIENTDFIQTLVFRLFDFIDPKYRDNDYTKEGTHKELIELFHDIANRNLSLLKDVDFSKINEESIDNKRLLLIDFIVQRIYFALDINKRIRKKHELHPNEKNKIAFYDKVKPLLSNIIDNSKEIGGGIIIAHTAHYLIETLNGVVRFYPEEAASILEMTAQITELSYRTGYTFDSSAIKEVVSLTEGLLADHKQLLRNDNSLNHLVTILNIYVETGRPEALELLWKLDEVFK